MQNIILVITGLLYACFAVYGIVVFHKWHNVIKKLDLAMDDLICGDKRW
jgi:hypothetical protein